MLIGDLLRTFVDPLLGLPVNHIWRGGGSAIFVELGELSWKAANGGLRRNPPGEMGIMIEWSWRIEERLSIICGSFSDETLWPRGCSALLNQKLIGADCFGRLPEIDLSFSNGTHLVSFMTAHGGPEWTIFERKGNATRWLTTHRDRLVIES